MLNHGPQNFPYRERVGWTYEREREGGREGERYKNRQREERRELSGLTRESEGNREGEREVETG